MSRLRVTQDEEIQFKCETLKHVIIIYGADWSRLPNSFERKCSTHIEQNWVCCRHSTDNFVLRIVVFFGKERNKIIFFTTKSTASLFPFFAD